VQLLQKRVALAALCCDVPQATKQDASQCPSAWGRQVGGTSGATQHVHVSHFHLHVYRAHLLRVAYPSVITLLIVQELRVL